MAMDAGGNPVSPANGQEANSNTNSNNRGNNKNTNSQQSGKVTRKIKGQKEIVIEVAALKGKGYPAPIDDQAVKKAKQ